MSADLLQQLEQSRAQVADLMKKLAEPRMPKAWGEGREREVVNELYQCECCWLWVKRSAKSVTMTITEPDSQGVKCRVVFKFCDVCGEYAVKNQFAYEQKAINAIKEVSGL